jgi:cholesterol oxidase
VKQSEDLAQGGFKMGRRQFMGLTALGGIGLWLTGCKTDPDDPAPPPADTQAIVIGTGFGGAVAALRLGQAGIRTVVLERGRRWPLSPNFDTFSPSLQPDQRSTWLRDTSVMPIAFANPAPGAFSPYIGVLERMDYAHHQVYAGAGVGGGSLVYGGMTVKPRQQEFAEIFPAELNYAELDSVYYPRVKQMLGAVPIPADVLADPRYLFSRVARDQTLKAGMDYQWVEQIYKWDVVRRELAGDLPPSAINGDLIYGNNTGAKNSLDHNYLPMAEATGNVSIHTQQEVTAIHRQADGRYVVDINEIDTAGQTVSSRSLTCQHLFLAAGSIRTTGLLLQARETGAMPNLPEAIGQGWGTNGNGMVMRAGIGANTGGQQAAPPVMAVNHFDNPISPLIMECANFPTGFETQSLMYLGCPLRTQRSTLTYAAGDRTRGLVDINWPADGNQEAQAAIRNTVEKLNQANGGTLSTSYFPDGVSGHFTYHPLGGAVVGQATDLYGRVNGHPGLYVVDGALVPGNSACSNPSWTIAALAEKCLDRIIAENFGV